MTPNSSVYTLNSISEYSRALESVRVVSRAVSLVEQGKVVDNFSVYEEAFQNLSQSLAAAKARGSMTPQLQQASVKLEGLLEKLSKRVEAASARVKEASSASFGARVIGWVSAPKEQILGAAKTAGNAGQWAWSHKKTVAGGVILGSAIYNDAFGSFRTAVAACKTFWTVITEIPAFVNKFTSQSEDAANNLKDAAKNVKQAAEDVVFPVGVGQERVRQIVETCRNAESGAECLDFVSANFEAMKECLPSENDPLDLQRWFWCVDNKISGGSKPFEQFKDERTSDVASTALNAFLHISAARFLGLKIPGGDFFNKYISPWILPNVILSSVYPQYIEDIKTYCASHPLLCTAVGTTAVLKGGPIGGGVFAGGMSLNYIDQEFLDGGINNATQHLLSHPDEVLGNLTEAGKQVRDELLEDSGLSFPLAATLPTAWSVGSQVLGIKAVKNAERARGVLAPQLDAARLQLAILTERKDLIHEMRLPHLDDLADVMAARQNIRTAWNAQDVMVKNLENALPAETSRYNPSYVTLIALTILGFSLPKIPKVLNAISSTASESNMTISDVPGFVWEKTPTLIVPQSMIDNQGTIITTVAIGILPQLAMFFVRRFV